MHGNCRGCIVSGCFGSLLVLAKCTDSTPESLEDLGGGGFAGSGVAGSGGSASLAGSAGRASPAGSGGGGVAGSGGSASLAGSGGATADAGPGGTSGTGGSAVTPVPDRNLIVDPSFETSLGTWSRFGPASLTRTTDVAHSGSASLLVSNRKETWQGPAYDVTDLVSAGAEYEVRAWLRQASADPVPSAANTVWLVLRRDCAQEEPGVGASTPLASATLDADWAELTALFQAPTCTLDSLVLYVEGLPAGVDLYLDDVSLVPTP
jgi:hypothetical protein